VAAGQHRVARAQPCRSHRPQTPWRLAGAGWLCSLAAFAGLSVGLLVVKMTRLHADRHRPAAARATLVLARPPAAVRVQPVQATDRPANARPDPRLLRDAGLILQNASDRGQRLSQRMLARELRGHGHHFPNDHLRQIAESIGLSCGASA
jgi:hypothetical protein